MKKRGKKKKRKEKKHKMNAKDKLKFLMGAKARRMWLLGIKNWHLYYGPEDAEEIEEWSEEEAEKVWKQIYENIMHGVWALETYYYDVSGLSPGTCPYCILYRVIKRYISCSGCGYGKRHLECGMLKSDFHRISHQFTEERKWFFHIEDMFWKKVCFPNEWYREVVERMGR